MKQISLLKLVLLFAMSITGLLSCKKQDVDLMPAEEQPSSAKKTDGQGYVENDMVMYWNAKTSIVLTGPFTPPEQARYFAMIQIAVHDALNSIKPKYERFALTNLRSQFASPDAAVASAAYWAIRKMNLYGSYPIDQWYTESLNIIPDGESKEQGKILGEKSADAIITKRSTDNFELANLIIPIPDGVGFGEYRSTLPFSNPGFPKIKALHQWGSLMVPFVTESNYQFRPTAPYPVTSSQYEADFDEVKSKGARVNHNRTPDESEIGVFWVERSTIGWNRFARNILASNKIDAWKTARLFALLHTAMVDGVSGCFEAKYHYFYWRPETAIRLSDDGNSNTTGDPNWLPGYTEGPDHDNPFLNVYTPPIPDYPSAHATFGGAAAEILKLFFETDNISVDQTSPTTPGVTRHYSSISQAARDNSLSRIYVGYHFRIACLRGEEHGKQIATYVFNNSFKEE